jgi:hypothetical protein
VGGNSHLKEIAIGAVSRDEQLASGRALRNLADAGLVQLQGVNGWEKIRNKVMHGNLVSPYSSEEDDRILLNMAGLLHSLTQLLISSREAAASAAVKSQLTPIRPLD